MAAAGPNTLKRVGLAVPKVLLPNKSVNLTKWTVIACDQYTSEPEYWKNVEKFVAEDPSTLHLIFPEVYLESQDEAETVAKINEKMNTYEKKKVLDTVEGFIAVRRSTRSIPKRDGLMVALDLECYDYTKGSQTLCRASEKTIEARLPPRIRIREKANIELPHIMVGEGVWRIWSCVNRRWSSSRVRHRHCLKDLKSVPQSKIFFSDRLFWFWRDVEEQQWRVN